MGHPVGALLRDRLQVEFVEADVEIGFNLVDMARTESSAGNGPLASRVLRNAETVFQDIERRLEHASPHDRQSFGPLIQELRRQIDEARRHHAA